MSSTDIAHRRKQQDSTFSPWDQPPYREIEKKIGGAQPVAKAS